MDRQSGDVMSFDTEPYLAALADARTDYAKAVETAAAKHREVEECDKLIRRLRHVIACLANQLGEKVDLPPEDAPPRRRRRKSREGT